MADPVSKLRKDTVPLSRRAVLGTMVCAPLAASAAPVPPALSAWSEALHVYRDARHRHEAFVEQVLMPACRRVEAGTGAERSRLMRQHRIFALEEEGNDLCGLRLEALHQLVMTPAPDAAALRNKVLLLHDEVFRHDHGEGLFGALVSDVDRLAGPGTV